MPGRLEICFRGFDLGEGPAPNGIRKENEGNGSEEFGGHRTRKVRVNVIVYNLMTDPNQLGIGFWRVFGWPFTNAATCRNGSRRSSLS